MDVGNIHHFCITNNINDCIHDIFWKNLKMEETEITKPLIIDFADASELISIKNQKVFYLVIMSPTNVIYEFQCGGSFCLQRSVEGFLINIPNLWNVIDDCEEGWCGLEECGYSSPQDDDLIRSTVLSRYDLAFILHERFKKISREYENKDKLIDSMNFDFDRVNELREGWWPVLVNWNGSYELKGYLTGWNCD